MGVDDMRMEAWSAAKEKRNDAVWYVVVGVAMLFLGGFHWGVAAGGVLMVIYGSARYLFWSRRARDAYDPWDDADIDAWEEEEMRP